MCNTIYKFYKFAICTINKNFKLYILFGIFRLFGAMGIFLDDSMDLFLLINKTFIKFHLNIIYIYIFYPTTII
jgi:hypothetical protein